MVPDALPLHPDRRAVLRAAAGGAVASLTALAGCSSSSSTTPTPTRTERPSAPYDSLFVRNPAGESFVTYTDENGEPEHNVSERLSSDADADRVTFTSDVDGVDDARAFLDGTDFETETVLLSEQPVGECQKLVVDYVTTGEDSFNVDFCRRLRPADVECSADERDVVLALVRFRYTGESSYTVGSGGSCERRGRGDDP